MTAADSSTALHRVLEESHHRGFLGPGAISPHITSAQGFADALRRACLKREISLLDLGSGGGLPGLPLFVWFEGATGVLLDARSKRTRFLDEAVEALDLQARVDVVTARAEEVLDELGRFDVVTARSFGPPSATLEIASSLLNLEGVVLVSEPPNGRLWAADGLHSLGLEQVSAEGSHIATFRKVGPDPARRRWKHIVDRPLVETTLHSPHST